MSDIFVSYAREDKATAMRLADALQQHGWSVWCDRDIPTGQSIDRVIERALLEARCVIVLWSHASVSSDWVKAEASEGRQRFVLVPAIIENVDPPLEFRRLQTADLRGWDDGPHKAFDRLIADVAKLLDRPLSDHGNAAPMRLHARLLPAVPTVILVAVVAILASWRVPTHVQLDLVASRARFTLDGTDAELTRIFDAIAFRGIAVDHFATLSLEPNLVQVADPVGYDLASDRYAESAWSTISATDAVVEFHALDDMRLPSVAIDHPENDAAAQASLRPITVPAAAVVTLEVVGKEPHTVTLTLEHRDPVISLPLLDRFQLTANHTRVTGLAHAPGVQTFTWRFELRPGSVPVEIVGRSGSLVVSLAPVSISAGNTVPLFSEGTIPITAIDFTRQDELGHRRSAVVAEGWLSTNAGAEPRAILSSEIVRLERLDGFRIQHIALDPARGGIHLRVNGVAGEVVTSRGLQSWDHRQSALAAIRSKPLVLGLGFLAWITLTTAAAYRFLPRRPKRTEALS